MTRPSRSFNHTPAAPARRPRAALAVAAALAALPVVIYGIGESAGWPWLRAPAERWLAERMQRQVQISGDEGFRLRTWGGLKLNVPRLVIGPPAWAGEGAAPTVRAEDARIAVRWSDLMAARSSRSLAIDALQARSLHLDLRRLADGRASWQVGEAAAADPEAGVRLTLRRVGVREGRLHVDDARTRAVGDVEFALLDGSAAASAPEGHELERGLRAKARGTYGEWPVQATLQTGSVLPWFEDAASARVPATLDATVGRARIRYDGALIGGLDAPGVGGQFQLSGPSLAAVGAPVGVTLPTTRAFDMRGAIEHAAGGRLDDRWNVLVDAAKIGESRLAGAFQFVRVGDGKPSLSGRLTGPLLQLSDLGVTIGAPAGGTEAAAARSDGKVLPDKVFDLPSLRAMNANVAVDIQKLETGHPKLQDVRPLKGHLTLVDAVLRLDELDARLAQGRIRGSLALDGRASVARWQSRLHATGLRLEQWITQTRENGAPPYASGRLSSRIDLDGRGKSTAELLASADGRILLFWTHGGLSHLVVEGAGLDVAQVLGVLVTGDTALPVTCGAAELVVKDGRATPKVAVVDTPDTVLWANGQVSLVDETLNLTVHADPKDFSPLSLRAPLRVTGTFAKPSFGVEGKGVAKRALPAAILAAIAPPLAALVPLLDNDDGDAKASAACRALLEQKGSGVAGAAAARAQAASATATQRAEAAEKARKQTPPKPSLAQEPWRAGG